MRGILIFVVIVVYCFVWFNFVVEISIIYSFFAVTRGSACIHVREDWRNIYCVNTLGPSSRFLDFLSISGVRSLNWLKWSKQWEPMIFHCRTVNFLLDRPWLIYYAKWGISLPNALLSSSQEHRDLLAIALVSYRKKYNFLLQ